MSHLSVDAGGAALASVAVVLVGGSVAAASVASTYPLLGGQAVRMMGACALLAAWARWRRHELRRPTLRECGWLVSLAAVGMAGYSVVLVHATAVADPAGVGMAIGAAPLVIVIVRELAPPFRRPPWRLLASAALVMAASVASESTRATTGPDLTGLFWSAAALAGVASITLLAAPIVDSLGPLVVTTATGGAGTVLLLGAILVSWYDGQAPLRSPTTAELFALAYLSVAVTTMVYLLWFGAVRRLGASRAGLFNGLIPITALVSVAVVGHGDVSPMGVGCSVLVLVGVSVGMTCSDVATDQKVRATPLAWPPSRP